MAKKILSKRSEKRTGHLENMVSSTKTFKVADLLEVYRIYDDLVIDQVFRRLLLPYTGIARAWVRDQVRDLVAGTDRGRMMVTVAARKASADDGATKGPLSRYVKPQNFHLVTRVLEMSAALSRGEDVPLDDVKGTGVLRNILDDLGAYFVASTNNYQGHVADWMAAYADGDPSVVDHALAMTAMEDRVMVKREDAWYVIVNTRAIYDQIEKIVQRTTLAFSRLLLRLSHALQGHTSTEENFSAGYEGLIRAARSYDPIGGGAAFTRHCALWIRSAILQRQRQASIITLPVTTWSQLAQAKKEGNDMSPSRLSALKERAEMFFASSANMPGSDAATGDDTENEPRTFETARILAPDAHVVLPSALHATQECEDEYEAADMREKGSDLLSHVFASVLKSDPSLSLSVLLWSLHMGIESSTVGEVAAHLVVSGEQRSAERLRQSGAHDVC